MNSILLSTENEGVRRNFKFQKRNTELNIMNSNSAKINIRRRKKFHKNTRGVIYLSHIPHGFYEDQMREYFNQFGKVRTTSVARSKKTGRSKGYGFVEFDDEDVAKIAAETMNNYLMYNTIIKCRYIPPEERKRKIFVKPYITGDFQRRKNRIINSENKLKAFSNLNHSTYLKKTEKKINEFKKFFEERGIDFHFKISPEKSQEDFEIKKNNTKSTTKTEEETEAEEEKDHIGILEIDESDHEIYFKTPPQVKKVIKKSHKLSDVKSKKLHKKNSQAEKKVKNYNSVKNNKEKNIKKNSKTKVNEKSLTNSSVAKKVQQASKNDISTFGKMKNAKVLGNINLIISKKEVNPKPCTKNSVTVQSKKKFKK